MSESTAVVGATLNRRRDQSHLSVKTYGHTLEEMISDVKSHFSKRAIFISEISEISPGSEITFILCSFGVHQSVSKFERLSRPPA
jgi:hypothetical protein